MVRSNGNGHSSDLEGSLEVVELKGMTMEALGAMPANDIRYLFREMHEDTRRPDSLTARLTSLNQLRSIGNGIVVVDNLSPLVDHIMDYKFRAVVGAPFTVQGKTKYSSHVLGQIENFGSYALPGITTDQKAKIAQRDITLELLKKGDLDVDVQIAQRSDKAYELWVSANSNNPLELNRITAALSSIGFNWDTHLGNKKSQTNPAQYTPDAADLQENGFEGAQYLHIMAGRGRKGFVDQLDFSQKKAVRVPSTEIYDRQMRMAGQIADALNSVRTSVDPNYEAALRTLTTLQRDIKKHGSFLFENRGLVRDFMKNVLDVIAYRTPATIVPQKSGGETIAYRVQTAH